MNLFIKRLWYSRYKHLVLVILDVLNIIAAWIVSAFVTGQPHLMEEYFLVLGIVCSQIFLFHFVQLYKISFKAISLRLLTVGIWAILIEALLILMFNKMFYATLDLTRIILAFSAYQVLFIYSYRIAYRILIESGKFRDTEINSKPEAVLYGVGIVGDHLTFLSRRDELPFFIKAIYDDDSKKRNHNFNGIKIRGDINSLLTDITKNEIELVIISTTNISKEKMQRLADTASKANTSLKIVPSLLEIESHEKTMTDIRDVDISDLLGREQFKIPTEPIQNMISGKIVMVTGAGGSIGSEICKQLYGFNPEQILLLDIDETEVHNLALELGNYTAKTTNKIIQVVCDIRNEETLNEVIKTYKPAIIFHAAAYKHVPLMEEYPREAIRNNIFGTKNLLLSAKKHGVEKIIIISTDKAVNPTSIMGATKRISELMGSMISDQDTSVVSVRFGNVLGSRGSVLPLFLNQIKNHLPLTVTHKDMVRYFMTTSEAVSLVFLAATLAKGGEVFVLDMGEPVNMHDFANSLINTYGNNSSKVIITGLRPGEKLFEELLTAEEGTSATPYKKIFKAKLSDKILNSTIDTVAEEFLSAKGTDIHVTFKKYIPTYNHQYSQETLN